MQKPVDSSKPGLGSSLPEATVCFRCAYQTLRRKEGIEIEKQIAARRAESVLVFLSGEGVTDSRLISEGFGPSRPIGDNSRAEGRSQNRRVEIVISEG